MPLYAKDPIVEAILGIELSGSGNWDNDQIKDLMCKSLPEYSTVKNLPSRGGAQKDSDDSDDYDDSELRFSEYSGLAFEKGNKSIHLRQDEFSFHWQRPYISWEVFFPEAMRCWGRASEIMPNKKIASIYLRYVNRIEVPITHELHGAFSNYFNNTPTVPSDPAWRLEQFFHQSIRSIKPYDDHVIITQTTLDETSTGVPCILDINVHTHQPSTNDEIEGIFQRFRQYKNVAFESLITETCRTLIR